MPGVTEILLVGVVLLAIVMVLVGAAAAWRRAR